MRIYLAMLAVAALSTAACGKKEPAKPEPAKTEQPAKDPSMAKEEPAKEEPAKEEPAKEEPSMAKEEPVKEEPVKEEPTAAAAVDRTAMAQEAMAAWAKGDAEACFKDFTADAVAHRPGNPGGEEVKGQAAIIEAAKADLAQMSNTEVKAKRITEAGDMQVVEYVMATDLKYKGEDGTEMTKRVTVPGAFVVHYTADNKVDEMWDFMDQANVMMQVGMIPGLPEGFTPVAMPEKVEIVKGEPTPGMAEAYKAFGEKMEPDTIEAAVNEMMHDDFTMVDTMSGKTVTKAQLVEHMKPWLGMFADDTHTVDKEIAAGNVYVALGTMTGTYKGGIPGAEANDQKVTLHSLSVAEFQDGKFKSYAGYENGLELAAQLGMMGGAAEKPAGEPTAAAGDTLGVAECDLYISKMRECMGALPDAARGAFENGMKTALDQWKQSIEAGGDAAKQALGQACKSTLDAAKQAAGQLCPNVKWE